MATLELYLIRHGVAAERGEEYPDDSKRPLTSDGIARLSVDGSEVPADKQGVIVNAERAHGTVDIGREG